MSSVFISLALIIALARGAFAQPTPPRPTTELGLKIWLQIEKLDQALNWLDPTSAKYFYRELSEPRPETENERTSMEATRELLIEDLNHLHIGADNLSYTTELRLHYAELLRARSLQLGSLYRDLKTNLERRSARRFGDSNSKNFGLAEYARTSKRSRAVLQTLFTEFRQQLNLLNAKLPALTTEVAMVDREFDAPRTNATEFFAASERLRALMQSVNSHIMGATEYVTELNREGQLRSREDYVNEITSLGKDLRATLNVIDRYEKGQFDDEEWTSKLGLRPVRELRELIDGSKILDQDAILEIYRDTAVTQGFLALSAAMNRLASAREVRGPLATVAQAARYALATKPSFAAFESKQTAERRRVLEAKLWAIYFDAANLSVLKVSHQSCGYALLRAADSIDLKPTLDVPRK